MLVKKLELRMIRCLKLSCIGKNWMVEGVVKLTVEKELSLENQTMIVGAALVASYPIPQQYHL